MKHSSQTNEPLLEIFSKNKISDRISPPCTKKKDLPPIFLFYCLHQHEDLTYTSTKIKTKSMTYAGLVTTVLKVP